MKKYLSIIYVFLTILGINAQNYQWHSYWGSNTSGSDIAPVSMAIDGNGNIYSACIFGGSYVQVLNTTITSNSTASRGDVVITKMDPTQNQLWQHILVSTSSATTRTATVSKIVVNNDNDLIAVGTFTDGVTFDNSHSMKLNNASGTSTLAAYVVRYNSSGVVQSMWQLPADEMTIGNVTVDNDNNIIIAGTFTNSMSFNPSDLNAQLGNFPNAGQLFIAKYSSTGKLLWVKVQGGDQASPSCTFSNAFVKADTDGSIYLGGTFAGTTNFSGSSLTSYAANKNMFLVKYSVDGNAVWQKRIGGWQNDVAMGIEISSYGDVALYGDYLSDSIYITGKNDACNNGFYTKPAATRATMSKIGIFAFEKETGNYRWWYSYGAGSTGSDPSGSYAHIFSMVCTNEGVWHIGAQTNWRYGDLNSYANFKVLSGGAANSAAIAKYGLILKDGTWVQHDDSGAGDALYFVLSREGELCNIGRLGGKQKELVKDLAVTPDKKSLYLLSSICVNADVAYTCVDNFWDSFNDIINSCTNGGTSGATRLSKYHYFQVYCPVTPVSATVSSTTFLINGVNTNSSYTLPTFNGVTNISTYAGNFYSTIIAKYDFPAFSPSSIPTFTVNQAYSQNFTLVSPGSKVTTAQKTKFYPLLIPGELDFSSNVLNGTITTTDNQEFGFIVIDSLENAGTLGQYYANQYPIRGNSRNIRYLTFNSITGLFQTQETANATFYPSICFETLNLKTEEENFDVHLCNMLGEVIRTYRNQKVFSVENFPSGIYYACLKTGNKKIRTSKFIVMK